MMEGHFEDRIMARRARRWFRFLAIKARRLVRRLDRQTPGWVHDLTPIGSSLLLHALAILVLALVIFVDPGRTHDASRDIQARLAPQLADDLTALAPGERAGDPFTTLDSDEPLSLTLELSQIDPAVSALPEVDASVALGRDFRPVSLSASVTGGMPGPAGLGTQVIASTPFSGRQAAIRAKLVRREGGTVESEKAVERGLDWIARHQRPDGSWGFDTHTQCKGRPCPVTPATASDTAATGLAVLPFLGAGHSPSVPGRYQRAVERGLAWLMAHQSADGNLFTGGGENHALYSHCIGTMALSEAYGVCGEDRYREPARKAVAYLIACQSSEDGGWRYYPGQPGDTSVVGWAMLALRSARLAGLEVPDRVLARASSFLDHVAVDGKGTTYSYLPGSRPSPVMTAEALLVRQYLGWPRNHPSLVQGCEIVSRELALATQRNIYFAYYAMQLLHNQKGKSWETWNPRIRNGLVGLQVISKGCERGSWDPLNPTRDRWGATTGRLYVTSLSLLTLEVYYRYLPLYRDADAAKW
jgi:hypothetical protein